MELAEPPQNNKLYQQNSPIIMVMHLMTAAGASAPADAVFRFTAGEAMQTEDDDEDTDRSEEYSDDGRVSDWRPSPSRQRARRLRQDFSLGHPPCGAGGDPLSVGNVGQERERAFVVLVYAIKGQGSRSL